MSNKIRKIIALNPVLIRGVLVAVAAVLAQVLGHTVIEEKLIDTIIDAFTAITALVTALWARGVVIAENKVVAWQPDPAVDFVVPGPATTDNVHQLQTAGGTSMRQEDARGLAAAA